MTHKMRVVDLFSGCGGMSLGFQIAGFDIVAAYDNWDAAIAVYRLNFDHPIFKADLGKVLREYEQVANLKPDVIIGGPHCQDFSHAGKRNEELGRADLTVAFAKMVASILPPYFVMENVDRAATSKRFKMAREVFRQAGYGVTERILNAAECGVPQQRKRVFLIGAFGVEDNFLSVYLDENLSKQQMTVKEYFEKVIRKKLDTRYYYRHPRNYSRRAIYNIDEPSATIRGVNRPIPSNYTGHPSDAASVTDKVRPLTTEERSYIQTFPVGFKFQGTKTDVEQMIGNAVPVKLAEYVARALQRYIADREIGKVESPPLQLKLLESRAKYKSVAA